MIKLSYSRIAATLVLLVASAAASAATLVKLPDLGKYWNSLSSDGSYTFANSFVAPSNGTVTAMGLWLFEGGSDLQFKIFDSIDGNSAFGPDAGRTVASSAVLAGRSYRELSYVGLDSGISSGQLVAGRTYWFAATTVGLGGAGPYTVGVHTQNSDGIVDNGTFWYSNAKDGMLFDGRNQKPEMAFSVTVSVVPEPSAYLMLLLGAGVLAAARRRRAGRA